MDITQLRYFLKTAELLNYTQAAERLFITRQSLRQAIGNLEGELGAPLFRNEHNHLSLTECGTYLALRGAEVVRDFEGMWADTVRLAAQQVSLKVAFSESLFPLLLPELDSIAQRFRVQFPHIPLELFQWDSDRVMAAVETGEIDCGCVLQMPCEHPGCTVHVLRTFPAAVDYGEDFPLRGREAEAFSLRMLDGLPCIGMGSPQRHLRPLWEDCLVQGVPLNYQVVPNTIDAFYQVQNSLAAGFDIFEDGNLGGRPIYSIPLPDYTFELVLLCHRSSLNAGPAELFCDFMEEEGQKRYPIEGAAK